MQILRETCLEAFEKAKKIGPDEVIAILDKKGLLGRGGAGYPTARKWKLAKDTKADRKFVICNADEGEPGTFKDKLIIKNNAETMIEGILIAAYTISAKRCFIYLRGEYENLRERLEEQIVEVLEKADTDITIEIVMGAGAYVCGEETAILQSIMGFRGHPMNKPPYPPVEGLWGKPTVVNNVETLTCAAQALIYDDWNPDLRLVSLSGNVSNPGVYEVPVGIKMATILDMARPKNNIKAASFGCFGGLMPINESDLITPEFICKGDCFHGAFTIILIDETNNILDICLSIAKFYAYESCGKCTPCREGNMRILNILKKIRNGKGTEDDLKTLKELAELVNETSICGLGRSAGNHILTSLEHFRADYDVFIKK
jgi:NADH:ubiquinone oxidoreductase subunit F (NADH-binding)